MTTARPSRPDAAATDVTAKRTFQAQRRLIREALEREGIADSTDALVLRLLARV